MGDAAKTIVLLAVVAAAVITGAAFRPKTPATPEAAHVPSDTPPVESYGNDFAGLKYAAVRLSPGNAVLLGSLDQTAQQHQMRMVWNPDDHRASYTLTGSHSVLSFPEEWSLPVEATLPDSAFSHGWVDSAELSGAAVTKERLAEDLAAVKVHRLVDENRTRRFVVPFFSDQTVHDRHVLATEIAHGNRVSVYLVENDESAFHQDRSEAIKVAVEVASEIIRRCEGRVLDFVEAQLGAITDLDDDGRLTFVMGHLSEHGFNHRNEQPITGCVRPDDFLKHAVPNGSVHTGGDIVYLDCSLPDGEELDAVLAHELTHAATFCVVRESECLESCSLPGWLNEAIAHYVEYRINPRSENLKHRLADFTRQPHRFPLVIPDSVQQLSLRRGPARAAACLFLLSTLQQMPADSLRTMICRPESGTQRLESIAGEVFPEIFRNWGLQSMASQRDFPRWDFCDSGERDLHLAGTAFTWTAPVVKSGTLEIFAPVESDLQITVVKSPMPRVADVQDRARQVQ